MSDELLPYYERELRFLAGLGGEFAQKFTKVAGRLKLGPDGTTDPHVERLIQAVAFLNARTRHKLDDDFPEIADSFLDVVYPHYLRPVPSLAMAQFELDASQAELHQGYDIARATKVETEEDAVHGQRCLYRTGYPVKLWPFRLPAAKFAHRPFTAPATPRSSAAQSVLMLRLSTFVPGASFPQFPVQRLRFYLHRGNNPHIHKLYEMLFTDSLLEIAVADSPRAENSFVLPRSRIVPVGFDREEGLLPHDERSFLGFRLLSEYFAFPEKHLFFDLDLSGIAGGHSVFEELKGELGDQLHLFFYFRQPNADLERDISEDNFRLGCTPIVNLFERSLEPFLLSRNQSEYLLVPDASRGPGCEIYSVNRVEAASPEGSSASYSPFYSIKHARGDTDHNTFFHVSARRAEASKAAAESRLDPGRDYYLSLVDLNFRPSQPDDWTIRIGATCFNGNLPAHLPGGAGPKGVPRPLLNLPDGWGPIGKVICIRQPTSTIRPPVKSRAAWQLISHLSLNHLSLVEGEDAAASLREILTLYNPLQVAEPSALIESIQQVQSSRVFRRVGQRAGGFGQGVLVQLLLDESRLAGLGAYLFASVLDRFLALYVNVNAFTELVAQSKQRLNQEEPWKWPKRTGEKILL